MKIISENNIIQVQNEDQKPTPAHAARWRLSRLGDLSILLIATALIFAYLIIKDLRIVRNDVKELTKPVPPSIATVNQSTPDNRQTIQQCEYKDVITENISQADKDDKIQKVIGYQNNKVGLYIYAEVKEFVDQADEMVNANGGDWGYVLIPYNVKDYDIDRWSNLFVLLGDRKLIPIIQLWDLDLSDTKKRDEQIRKSSEFLDSLRWPIKNRYVSVYNEPNDSKFWRGKVNPEEYAEILEKTINTLKIQDKNFFVLNGAFNSSARSGGDYLDEREFLTRMNNQVPGIFKRLDGWASHPYPQPNFSGPIDGTGRDSIRAYEWELDILSRNFQVDTSKLPVFITETGWAHKEGNKTSSQYALNESQVADRIRAAYEKVWLPDDRVVAVTPFTIRYNPPFDHFSWVTENGNPYPQFNAIKDMEKTRGKPPVVTYTLTKGMDCKPENIKTDK